MKTWSLVDMPCDFETPGFETQYGHVTKNAVQSVFSFRVNDISIL